MIFFTFSANEDVRVQVGGSDQWGNITAGTELIRRVIRVEGAYGLTFPLLLKSDGTKIWQVCIRCVWLSKEKLTPYHFYQYLLNTSDSDVVTLLRMLTFLPLDHIERIEQDMSTALLHTKYCSTNFGCRSHTICTWIRWTTRSNQSNC